jgi:hypothetical protein
LFGLKIHGPAQAVAAGQQENHDTLGQH